MPHPISKRVKFLHPDLTLNEQRYCELRAAGLNKTESYCKAFAKSTASRNSLSVMASTLEKKPEILARIADLQSGLNEEEEGTPQYDALKQRLLNNPEFILGEAIAGLYSIATQGATERTRIEAWRLLGTLKVFDWFVSRQGASLTVNNNQLAATAALESNDPNILRYEFMRALTQMTGKVAKLPESDVNSPVIDADSVSD